MRDAVAKGLRGVHRVGALARSRLRLLTLAARYPGLHTEGRVFLGAGCDIVVNAGSTLWLRDVHVDRDVTMVVANGATMDLAGFRVGRGAVLVCREGITLGRGSGLAEYSVLRDANHAPGEPLDASRFVSAPITIGRDVWVAANTTILAGVDIGDGAIVAAGAVVTRDVPPGAVVAGVPARVVGTSPARGRSDRMSDPTTDPGIPDDDVDADDLPDDPITAREAAEQELIEEGESEAGAELGDQMP